MNNGFLQDDVRLCGSVNTANRAGDRKRHPAVDRFNVELVLLTTIASDLDFHSCRRRLVALSRKQLVNSRLSYPHPHGSI